MKKTLILSVLSVILFTIFVSVIATVTAKEIPPLPDRNVMSQEYWNLWNDEVQQRIDGRIEKYRKADAKIELSDVKPGTEIKIEQISHEFLFGANMFNFGQLGSKELDDKYKAVYHTLFNSAVIPFYWEPFEPEPGKPRYSINDEDNPEFWAKTKNCLKEKFWRRPATDQMVEYCENHDIYRHGHPIIWGNDRWHHPAWLPKKVENIQKMELQFEKRIRELAQHYKGRINRWDIVNESSVDSLNPHHPKYDEKNPSGAYGILPRDYTYKAFKISNEVFPPSVVQCINDYANDQGYVNQVNDLRKRGIRIDVMGLQMHLFNPKQCADIAKGAQIQTPTQVYNMLSVVEKAGVPLHLSEITITAPNDSPEGREIQANIARNLYRQWFSWQSMIAITWWNIVDGCGAPGEPTTSGLFTRQMEPKPAYYALDRLINHEWKTNFVRTADSKNVSISFRGFKGKYKIFWIDKEGKEQIKELTLK
ncbi:MAG: endo-1,4-beta-xylanase [Planctomycetaceae bacterium]|jgi:GH35 family endo-1,4-beta-xylanase|nr:endo-1,4-beta-xylanase [Planctomycetaceae bacterium]